MSWLSSDDFSSPSVDSQLAAQETAIIEHMNTDHAHSLIAYCQYFHQVEATHAQMLGIDSDGFDVNVNNGIEMKILRFNFDHPIHDAQSARAALVRMSQLAKA
jgi:putative heme iron utilization protein